MTFSVVVVIVVVVTIRRGQDRSYDYEQSLRITVLIASNNPSHVLHSLLPSTKVNHYYTKA